MLELLSIVDNHPSKTQNSVRGGYLEKLGLTAGELGMQPKGYRIWGRVIIGDLTEPIHEGVVVVYDNLIAWVGRAADLPSDHRTALLEDINLPGRSVMPGLIDGHTHISFGEARTEEENALYSPPEFRALRAVWDAKKVLQAGVTSAFDAATTFNVAQCVRDAIDSGMFEGPRFAVSGKQLTNHQGLEDSFPNNMEFPIGQAAVLVKTRDDLIEAIRYQVKDEVDAIKVSGSSDNLITPDSLDGSAFTLEELRIIADETHRLDKICTIHARSRTSARDAAKAGFDVIFHASYIDDQGIEACLANGCSITPTLTLLVNLIEATQGQDAAGASGISAFQREVNAARLNLAKAYRAGVPFIAGSESGWSPVPFGQWHARELQIFVELLGLTPLQAIHSATLGVTRTLKRFGHKVGKLEAGRYADILVINGDPTRDITLLQKKSKIDYVIKGGKCVDLTPPPPRKRMWYERQKVFLAGVWDFNETSGAGELRR
jgi:imidazolonepropionase-like amidohydrolase